MPTDITPANLPRRLTSFGSKFLRGVLQTPAPVSANSYRPARPPISRKSSADGGQVHSLTGVCPTVALHVLVGLSGRPRQCFGSSDFGPSNYGIRPGAINPNLFQDQMYKFGSFGNPDASIAKKRSSIPETSIAIARELALPRHFVLAGRWFELPGNQQHPAAQALSWRNVSKPAMPSLRPISECWWNTSHLSRPSITPTLPIGAWRYLFARSAGPQAKVLVDTGHHYQAQNIEQIVAWLLDENMLGGFHFNDRRYADDDLTMGSIDPYQVFRIFHEILFFEWEQGEHAGYCLHDRSES